MTNGLRRIGRMGLPRRRLYGYLVGCAIALLLLFLLVPPWYNSRCEHRIRVVKSGLWNLRMAIKLVHHNNGQYPDSLAQVLSSMRQGDSGNWDRFHVDLTSDRQEAIPEYRELNSKGGYFYDPNSGEIRLNLTQPVRVYLPRYTGKYADRIPAEW